MATFAQLFPLRDLAVLQAFTQCQLAVEETLGARARSVRENFWFVDGGKIRLSWNASGQLVWRKHVKYGMQHGLSETWSDSGQRLWRANFKNGKRHGHFENWDMSGQIRWRSHWQNDRLHGITESWNASGELVLCRRYVDGVVRRPL